ncbi:MAG: hypothetical protein IKY83_07125, partial [Proteobacteria bacterium]|nr:hypothetical protein [Pseudomonadota bacterium]
MPEQNVVSLKCRARACRVSLCGFGGRAIGVADTHGFRRYAVGIRALAAAISYAAAQEPCHDTSLICSDRC